MKIKTATPATRTTWTGYYSRVTKTKKDKLRSAENKHKVNYKYAN